MPVCVAFTRNGTPCTATGWGEHTLCFRHMPMRENNPERFRHDQEIYQESHERITAGTHVRIGTRLIHVYLVPMNIDNNARAAVFTALNRLETTSPQLLEQIQNLRRLHQEAAAALPPAEQPHQPTRCSHMIRADHQCTRASVENGMCRMHHRMNVRHQEDRQIQEAMRVIDRLRRINAPIVQIDARIDQFQREGLIERGVDLLRRRQNLVAVEGFRAQLRDAIQQGGQTIDTLTNTINTWRVLGFLSPARCDMLIADLPILLQWHQHNQRPRFGPNQREAQLAADPQNVHTNEISTQMRQSIEVLLACTKDIPNTQTNTMAEIQTSWEKIAPPACECLVNTQRVLLTSQQRVDRTYRDLVTWWNRDTIFNQGDKLFRKCVRALWWTIKQFPDETRTELEKRFWEECESGVDMCTQGHMARLSNVMIGYHDAYKPQVSVGEILQQRMAAISAMDIEYEEQIRRAEEVLSELNVPSDQHQNWLSAF